jgi:hypothetical protein
VVQNSVARNQPRKSTVFQRLQFPVDYQENCRDDNIQFADHSKELLGDSRPKTLFQRLSYPRPLNQYHVSHGSVLPQARVLRSSLCSNFKAGP